MDARKERPTSSEEKNDGDENEENEGAAPPAQEVGRERMIATASTLAGENPRPPIQETLEGEMLYPQPAQIGSDICGYYSVDALDLEEELEVIDIMDDGNGQLEILAMSVETSPAIVAGL
ncbi:Hypothetical predicted protein [Paramuricea clavata]|uniref:Uncharacterized protein n=1 Tax=Paramuricea clavata TaxID=317549 RepID=A0A7D9EBP3_PARCT|nr:Hypothetical predicted protein [Paramuricea clavata]